MTENKINTLFIPQINKIKDRQLPETQGSKSEKQDAEFKGILEQVAGEENNSHGVSISQHAQKRLQERNLEMDSNEFFKLRNAIDTLRNKGGRDSLVVTGKAAYIVDVDKGKIVTAIDRNDMAENVFTKIDSTLFVD
ncbi:MAG: flagellar protein [Pseudomonadota bacterium]